MPLMRQDQVSPLTGAVKNGNKKLILLLIAKNANPNGATEYYSPLAQAKDCSDC